MAFSKKAKRELVLIGMLILMAQLFYILFYSETGYRQLQNRRSELQKLQVEHEHLLQEQQLYLERIEQLKHDPHALERYMRDRYNYARPGDVIINIKPAPAPGQPGQKAPDGKR
jgi:cell division protein FtsB